MRLDHLILLHSEGSLFSFRHRLIKWNIFHSYPLQRQHRELHTFHNYVMPNFPLTSRTFRYMEEVSSWPDHQIISQCSGIRSCLWKLHGIVSRNMNRIKASSLPINNVPSYAKTCFLQFPSQILVFLIGELSNTSDIPRVPQMSEIFRLFCDFHDNTFFS